MSAFGFDPSIILQGKTASLEDMLRPAQQMQAMQVQRASLGELLRKQQQEQMLAQVYRQNANNPEGIGQALMQQGMGQQALGWMDHEAEARLRKTQADKAGSEMLELARSHVRNQVAAAKSPEQYEQILAGVPPELRAKIGLPEQYDQGALEAYVAGGVPALKRAEWAHADEQGTKRDAAAETRARIIASGRAAEAGAKQTTETKKNYLQGFKLRPEAEPSDEEMKAIRKAQALTRTMDQTIAEINRLYQLHGNSPLPGPAKAQMEALTTDLTLAAKGPELYQLGVIAGPDEKLLGRLVAQPTSAESTILDFIGDDQSMARLATLRGQIARRFSNSASSLGFDPDAPPAKAPAKAAKPKTAPDKPKGGAPPRKTAEQLRAELAEIDALLAADQ